MPVPNGHAEQHPTFQPAMRLITAITNASPASVTTSFAHNYQTGDIVRLLIPLGWVGNGTGGFKKNSLCYTLNDNINSIKDRSLFKKMTNKCAVCGVQYTIKKTLNSKNCSPKCSLSSNRFIPESFWNNASHEDILDRWKEYFEKRVIRNNDSCWGWVGSLGGNGYGTLPNGKNRRIKAHRASYIIHRGIIPKGFHVLHHCDNSKCTNPDHLYLGTHKDNMMDMKKRGRYSLEKALAVKKKFTRKQILNIRNMAISKKVSKIAEQYCVRYKVIWNIVTNKTYKDCL